MATAIKTNPQSTIRHRMTEVIIPDHHMSHSVIFPLVASISQVQQKNPAQPWLTWITHHKPSIAMIQSFGASLDNLRIVHTQENSDNRWIIWEALQKGNSHTVIADSDFLSQEDITELEQAAKIGHCSGIIFRPAKNQN
jgi:cell division inhibitor SulA